MFVSLLFKRLSADGQQVQSESSPNSRQTPAGTVDHHPFSCVECFTLYYFLSLLSIRAEQKSCSRSKRNTASWDNRLALHSREWSG